MTTKNVTEEKKKAGKLNWILVPIHLTITTEGVGKKRKPKEST